MQLVEHSDRLVRIFGRWPSFHDAEVLRVILDRTGSVPTLEVQIHVFEMTSELDRAGHYLNRNDTLVTLRFLNVVLEELGGFNEQNVLFEMSIASTPDTPVERRLRVEMSSSYGFGATFDCEQAEVVEVKPFEAAA